MIKIIITIIIIIIIINNNNNNSDNNNTNKNHDDINEILNGCRIVALLAAITFTPDEPQTMG